MRWRKGPRPWPIHAFALTLLTIATLNLSAALLDLTAQQEFLRALGLGFLENRDGAIIASSAWFTIELIPIVLVWGFASRFARTFISVMAAIKALLLIGDLLLFYALPGLMVGQGIALAAVALLYTRDADRWFAKDEVDLATFG